MSQWRSQALRGDGSGDARLDGALAGTTFSGMLVRLLSIAAPNGTFKVNRMDADHLSQEWDNAPMPHTMFFDMHGHAIHGFFDVKHLGSPVSHGCVRLAPANAATLFALVQGQGMSQTTVVVSGQTPARGGEEMARRRAPTGYDYQPTPAPPGYFLPPRSYYAPQRGYTW